MRFLLLLLLTGCAGMQAVVPVETLVFRCNDSSLLTAREAGSRLQLMLPVETRELSRRPSRVGRLFKAKNVELLINGDQAELTIARQGTRQCSRDRGAEVWQDARFRGVEFRAAGTKPGWFAELSDQKLVYAGDYGQQKLSFLDAQSFNDDNLVQTTIVAVNDGHRIKLLLQTGDCWETASRRMFDIRVTLDLDGRIEYGCGKKLR
ncbi:MAG: hypothetical protein L3J63_00275 [Geopsychrobacter sp.]|nr:hypothetical protein [Geopsychrobacter sp.]